MLFVNVLLVVGEKNARYRVVVQVKRSVNNNIWGI